MGDCHFDYTKACTDKKSCKYSFASWCPTCERSPPRRRSKSEVTECRKKCKEMKSPTSKKYFRSQEYENMEFESDYGKDFWYEAPKENFRHLRSSQLCELPTSYISNNCQSSKLSTDYTKTYEPLMKMKQEDLAEVYNYSKCKITNKVTKEPPVKPSACYYDNHLSFDTSTYFDRMRDTPNLEERYRKEIVNIREKMTEWKNATKNLESNAKVLVKCPPVHSENPRMQDKYSKDPNFIKGCGDVLKLVDDIISISQSEIGPRPKKVSVKTKKVVHHRTKKFKPPLSKSSSKTEFAER